MTVVPNTKDKTALAVQPLTIQVPAVKKDKDKGPAAVPDVVKSMAGQLRVGDEIQLTYVKSGTALMYSDASAKWAGDPARDEASVFTFSGRRTVTVGGQRVEAAVVTRGPMTWTFLVPDADPKEDGYQADAELLKKVKECKRGNKVRLTYDPADYLFWLRAIEVVTPDDGKKDAGPDAEKKDADSGAGQKDADDAPATAKAAP
jgi:hypothetical protein